MAHRIAQQLNDVQQTTSRDQISLLLGCLTAEISSFKRITTSNHQHAQQTMLSQDFHLW